jgi:macrolide phosphotransferase
VAGPVSGAGSCRRYFGPIFRLAAMHRRLGRGAIYRGSVRRNPIELAAVATAAVPGLTPTAVSSAPDDPADFDSALLLDTEGKRWRVRSPRHAEASARLETEFLVLQAFAPGIRAELPFLMPTVAGTVRQGTLSTFVYSHLSGATSSLEELSSGSAALAREIGTALAAIHDLPRSLVSNADLPSYTPNEFRQRRLNELDQAATTGKIPPLLLRRWEHALEDVSLWRFNPSVVHGDLHEDNILVDAARVTAVTGWTDLRIGDPADDMAWLVASNDQDFVDTVLAQYAASRRDVPDTHLLRRAALSAEFALAQYLVKGLAADDRDMIHEAESMLAALAEDVAEHGGQPISVEPLPQPAVTVQPIGPDTSGSAVDQQSAGAAVHVTPIPRDEVPGGRQNDDAGAAPENGPSDAHDAAADTQDDPGTQVPAGTPEAETNASGQLTRPEEAQAEAPRPAEGRPGTAGAPAVPPKPSAANDTSTTALTVVPAERSS